MASMTVLVSRYSFLSAGSIASLSRKFACSGCIRPGYQARAAARPLRRSGTRSGRSRVLESLQRARKLPPRQPDFAGHALGIDGAALLHDLRRQLLQHFRLDLSFAGLERLRADILSAVKQDRFGLLPIAPGATD